MIRSLGWIALKDLRRLFRRREAREQEPVARQAGHHERGKNRRCARNGKDVKPFVHRCAGQSETGIGHQRGPGIAQLRHGQTVCQHPKKPWPLRCPVVIVVRNERTAGDRDTVDLHQAPGDTGVFGRDDVRPAEHVERAQGNVIRSANRCRDDV